MIDGIPNRPLYFYQKDIIDPYEHVNVNLDSGGVLNSFPSWNPQYLMLNLSIFGHVWSKPYFWIIMNN